MSQGSVDKQGEELKEAMAGPSLVTAATNPTIQADPASDEAGQFSSDAEYYHFDNTKSPSPAPIPARYSNTKKTQQQQGGGGGGYEVQRRTRARTRRKRVTQKKEIHERIDADSIDGDSDSSIDEYYDVESLADSIDESLTWRGRMQSVLHNHWFHLAIVCLVALDAFIVIFELLLDVGAFGNNICSGEGLLQQSERCHYENRERCGPHSSMILTNVNVSVAPGNGLGNVGLCVCKYRSGRRVCVDQSEPLGINPALVLHYSSLAILSLFMVEIALKFIAFRLKYFTHKFEVFDGIVVVLSWVLDVASLAREEAFEAAVLLILLRLWRVVRIVNGAVLTAKVQVDNQLDEARAEARRIIHAYHKCQDKLETAEKENTQLKDQLKVRQRGKALAGKSRGEKGREGDEGEHSADL